MFDILIGFSEAFARDDARALSTTQLDAILSEYVLRMSNTIDLYVITSKSQVIIDYISRDAALMFTGSDSLFIEKTVLLGTDLDAARYQKLGSMARFGTFFAIMKKTFPGLEHSEIAEAVVGKIVLEAGKLSAAANGNLSKN